MPQAVTALTGARIENGEAHMVEAVRDQWVIAAGIVLFLIAAVVWWRNR